MKPYIHNSPEIWPWNYFRFFFLSSNILVSKILNINNKCGNEAFKWFVKFRISINRRFLLFVFTVPLFTIGRLYAKFMCQCNSHNITTTR